MRSFAPLAVFVGLAACAADPEVIVPEAGVLPDVGLFDRPSLDAPLDARPDATDATVDRGADVAAPDAADVAADATRCAGSR